MIRFTCSSLLTATLFAFVVLVSGSTPAAAQPASGEVITAPKSIDLGDQIRELKGERAQQTTKPAAPRKDCGKEESDQRKECKKGAGIWYGVNKTGKPAPECCCDCPSGNPCSGVEPLC